MANGPAIGGISVAVMVAGNINQNTFHGTQFFARLYACTNGALEGNCSQNDWDGDLTLLNNPNGTKSIVYGNSNSNTFKNSYGSGVIAYASGALKQGQPVGDLGNFNTGPYTTGSSVFAGIPVSDVNSGITYPLVKSSGQMNIVKAPSAVSTEIDSGNLLIPATGGFVKAAAGQSAPVIAGPNGDPGHVNMQGELRLGSAAIY